MLTEIVHYTIQCAAHYLFRVCKHNPLNLFKIAFNNHDIKHPHYTRVLNHGVKYDMKATAFFWFLSRGRNWWLSRSTYWFISETLQMSAKIFKRQKRSQLQSLTGHQSSGHNWCSLPTCSMISDDFILRQKQT